jgi:hypothetical protein
LVAVIELCERCGFDIPSHARACPTCGDEPVVPSRAALQVAGLALPTRSVHRLPATRPGHEPDEATVGPARGARSAFECTSVLVTFAVLGALLGWMARLDRYVGSLPSGTADRIDAITEAITWASVVGLGIGLLSMAAWAVRRVCVGLTRRLRRSAFA